MAYCAPRGIPYLEFREWDQLSQDAAMAWAARDADVCGGCGTHRHDWLDSAGMELHDAPMVVRDRYCPGCAALARHTADPNREERPGVAVVFVPASRVDATGRGTVSA